MKSTQWKLWCAVLGVLLLTAELPAASCPYCGKIYGEPAPGDEARVYELRKQHELTCPARGGSEVSSPTASTLYGVVTIYNPNPQDINYQIQYTTGGAWSNATVKANSSYYHWQTQPADFRIRFDSSLEPGYQEKSYSLDHNVISGRKPVWTDGKQYEFSIQGIGMDLAVASEKTLEAYKSYGVVTINNASDQPISYQIRYRKNEPWAEPTTIQPGSSRYYWAEEPTDFKIRYDGSLAKGTQEKSKTLKCTIIKGRKPTAADGLVYEFTIPDKSIKLNRAENVDENSSLTAANISMAGSGTGQTSDGDFGAASRAQGTVKLTFMPRINGVIPTRDGSWAGEMVENQTSPANALHKTQLWKFHGDAFGDATAVISGSATGASGTASGWVVEIPGNDKVGKVQIKFAVQFTGNHISLSNFSKVY